MKDLVTTNNRCALLAATIITSGQLLVLNKNGFAITVKQKQLSKRVDIGSIHAHIHTEIYKNSRFGKYY